MKPSKAVLLLAYVALLISCSTERQLQKPECVEYYFYNGQPISLSRSKLGTVHHIRPPEGPIFELGLQIPKAGISESDIQEIVIGQVSMDYAGVNCQLFGGGIRSERLLCRKKISSSLEVIVRYENKEPRKLTETLEEVVSYVRRELTYCKVGDAV